MNEETRNEVRNLSSHKLLFETGKVDADSMDDNGQTPLWRAVEGGHGAVVKLSITS
jgi:Ankyrin repeats (many copies)